MSTDQLSTLLHELDDLAVSPPPPAAVRARGNQLRHRRQAAAGAGLLGVLAAAFLGVGALTGQQDTSLPPAPYATDPAETDPDIVAGEDLGYLQGLIEDGGELVATLDRVVWLDQDELMEKFAQEGRDPAEAPGFEVVNEREDLRRYKVSPDAEVSLTVGLAPPDLQGGSVPSTLEELRTLLADPMVAGNHLFDLRVVDGVVVSIDHRYMS